MNEEEAKTKWCPFVQKQMFAHPDWSRPIEITNRNDVQDDHKRKCCIASECMCWAWDTEIQIGDARSPTIQTIVTSKTQWHCGLSK